MLYSNTLICILKDMDRCYRVVFHVVCLLRIMICKSLEGLHWGLCLSGFQGMVRAPQASKLPNKNLAATSNKVHFKISFQIILMYIKVGVIYYSWLRCKHLASLLGHFVPFQEYRKCS